MGMETTGKKEFTLVVREDEMTGETGWVVEDLIEMDEQPSVAYDSYLIAHDIVEHVNGIEEIGGIGEELQAMGGIWNTRGKLSDIRRPHPIVSAHESLAHDFCELARRWFYGEETLGNPPELVETGYEEDFEWIWNHTMEMLPEEADEYYSEEKAEEFRKAAEAYFHYGIQKHEEMYGDGCKANVIFYEIVYTLETLMKRTAEEWECIKLTIDFDNREASAYMDDIYDYDEYDEEEEEEYAC
jgi:hypothetical protein